MKPLAISILVAAALALVPEPVGATSCAIVVEWNGATYGAIGDASPPRGMRLGTGVIPGCERGDDDVEVPVYAVPGVEARYAVVAEGGRAVNRAFPLLLPEHPLRELVFGRARTATGCRASSVVRGTIERLHEAIRVETERGPRTLFVEARTRMEPRFGPMGEGDDVRARVRRCRTPSGATRPFVRTIRVVARAKPADDRAVDADVVLGAALTAVLMAAGFAVRAPRRR